jgi:hypothetical protein
MRKDTRNGTVIMNNWKKALPVHDLPKFIRLRIKHNFSEQRRDWHL